MKRELTKRQEEALSFIEGYIQHNNQSPTLAEICEKLSKTTRTIVQHLDALQDKGFIYREKGKHRGIVLLKKREMFFSSMERIPITSLIGCDNACVYGDDTINDYILISNELKKKYGVLSAGRAVGLSMEAAGIRPGDVLLIKPTNDIGTGDIVVVRLENSVLAKKIVFSENSVTLFPMSDSQEYKPLVFSRSDNSFSIIGKVVDVIANPDKNKEEVTFIPEIGHGNNQNDF